MTEEMCVQISPTPAQCFMCCEQTRGKLISNSGEICKRFCVLVSRFLDFNFHSSVEAESTLNKYKKKGEFGENTFICCRSCVPFVESFCVDYHQLTRVKLELTSNLRSIFQILNLYTKKNESDKSRGFQTQLRQQCQHFLNKKDFPFVKLERQQMSYKLQTTLPEPISTEPCIKYPIKLEYSDLGVENQFKDDDDDIQHDDIFQSTEVEIDQTQEPPLSLPNSSHVQTHDDDDVHMVTNNPVLEPNNTEVVKENSPMDSVETEPQSQSNATTSINEKFKCKTCGIEFNNIAQYSLHKRILHKPKNLTGVSFKCDHCDERFSSRIECHTHQQWDCRHQTVTLQQVMTQMRLDRNVEIQGHHNEWTMKSKQKVATTENLDELPYKCGMCERSFNKAKYLRYHERRMHSNSRKYACRFCERQFKVKKLRMDHEMIHTGCRPFKCPECDSSFKQKIDLRKHLHSMHNTTHVPEVWPHMPTQPMSKFARRNKLLFAMITSSLPVEDSTETDECNPVTSQKPESQIDLQKDKKKNHLMPESDNKETFKVPPPPLKNQQAITHAASKLFKCEHCHLEFKHFSSRLRHQLLMHKINHKQQPSSSSSSNDSGKQQVEINKITTLPRTNEVASSSTTNMSNGDNTNRNAPTDFEESPVYLVKPEIEQLNFSTDSVGPNNDIILPDMDIRQDI